MAKANKTRCALGIIALIAAVFFTSCVDYVQSISMKGNKYAVYVKFTLSKMLLSMAGEDADEWADKLISEEDMFSGFSKVNTDSEVGAECRLLIDPKTRDAGEKALLPSISKNKAVIPFLPGEFTNEFKSDDADTNDMMMAVLSAAKCRMLVSKNIVSVVESAYFEGKGGQNYSVAVFDYGDVWGIEVPFTVLMESSAYKIDKIVVIKG